MSVSGMKKQLHKASQLVSERLMGAEGTKMDEDFLKMEKSVMAIHSLLSELISRTTEFIQPNPAYRVRLSMLHTMSRLRGHQKAPGYTQTESMLGECMLQYSQELGHTSEFGGALHSVGESFLHVSEARDVLDQNVKQTFIDPMTEMQETEVKDIRYQLRKLNGRRLDFDYKRLRRGKVSLTETHQAWDKYLCSKETTERSMFTLLQKDSDQLSRLSALVSALLEFHRNAHHILLGLHGNLQDRLTAASNRPERKFRSKKIRMRSEHNGSFTFHHQPSITGEQFTVTSESSSPSSCYAADADLLLDQPCCRALYPFHPSDLRELTFDPDDIITLTGRVDREWFQGAVDGRTGIFPVSYVEILVPLPV